MSESSDLPSVAVPTFESLHPQARWGMRCAAWLGYGLPAFGLSLAAALLLSRLGDIGFGVAWGWLLPVSMIAAMLAGWRYAALRYLHTSFRLDDSGIELHRGVWWRSETRVPRSRVQHTDIERGPWDRRLGTASLIVHTAGTQTVALRISGLAAERALALRDALLQGHDERS